MLVKNYNTALADSGMGVPGSPPPPPHMDQTGVFFNLGTTLLALCMKIDEKLSASGAVCPLTPH